MKGMGLIKLNQETDLRTLNNVLFDAYNLIIMNIIEYRWNFYLGFKMIGIIITHTLSSSVLSFILLTT